MPINRVLNNEQNSVLVCNKDGEITHVNESCEHLFGYGKEEMIGQLIELVVPDYAKTKHVEFRKNYMQCPIHKDQGARMGLKGQRKDGSVFEADVVLSPLYTVNGELSVIAVVRDISDVDTIMTNLRAKLERLDSIKKT